jgi:hypothetical protein
MTTIITSPKKAFFVVLARGPANLFFEILQAIARISTALFTILVSPYVALALYLHMKKTGSSVGVDPLKINLD